MVQRPDTCRACRVAAPIFPFTMAFQPIVDVRERRIDGYEALVRGPTGESAGSILSRVTPENLYGFDQACRIKAIELAAKLKIDRRLSINFLPNAIYEPRACIQATLEVAARTGFGLSMLTFEIAEHEHISDDRKLLAIIHEYRRHGFSIALDDFAIGYSGLARLAELKPDIIKIDRALVKDCDKDRFRMKILSNMIALCGELETKVVMEGVERAEEVDALCQAGARYMQGFYFGRPLLENIASDEAVFPA